MESSLYIIHVHICLFKLGIDLNQFLSSFCILLLSFIRQVNYILQVGSKGVSFIFLFSFAVSQCIISCIHNLYLLCSDKIFGQLMLEFIVSVYIITCSYYIVVHNGKKLMWFLQVHQKMKKFLRKWLVIMQCFKIVQSMFLWKLAYLGFFKHTF